MADAPSSTPSTTPPETVVDTLSGLRVEVKDAKDTNAVSDTLVDRTLAALKDAREQAITIGETARDKLRAELAQWSLENIPEPIQDAVEQTRLTVEDIYKGFQERTVLFPKFNAQEGIGKITKLISSITETVTTLQETLGKHLLPIFMAIGLSIPEWMQPKGLGMKELFAALTTNKRTLESSEKDEANMRAVIGLLGELNGTKPLANQMSLTTLLARAVELAPAEKSALTTKDVLDSAKLFAEKVKKAETPATPAAAAPTAAPIAPAPTPAAGTAPTPAATR